MTGRNTRFRRGHQRQQGQAGEQAAVEGDGERRQVDSLGEDAAQAPEQGRGEHEQAASREGGACRVGRRAGGHLVSLDRELRR